MSTWESYSNGLFGSGASLTLSGPHVSPTPPDEPIQFPLDRLDIAQVWHENMWVWAAVRASPKGRPRKGMRGVWLGGGIFVPWSRSSGIGLGLPPPLPNSLDDAILAAAELAGKSSPRSSRLANLLGFRARRGRPRRWTADERARLLNFVFEQATARGKVEEKVFRSKALQKAFGGRSACAIRRQFYFAWAEYRRTLNAQSQAD